MPEISTRVEIETSTYELSHTLVFLGDNSVSVSGLPPGGAEGEVVTKSSATEGDAEWAKPSIPWDSTNW